MEKRSLKQDVIYYGYFTFLLIFIGLQPLKSQQKVSLTLKNVSLHQILMEIKKQSGKNIVYNNNLIEKYTKESIEIKDLEWDKAIYKALEGKNLEYKLIDNVIIIEPINSKKIPEKPQELKQNLRGMVIDAETNAPLVGATVAIMDAEYSTGTTTNPDGSFIIKDVPVGRHKIVASYIGYKKVQIDNILVLSAKENVVDISLNEQVEKLDEIKVTAYNKNEAINDMATVSARAFTIEETEKFAGSWGDPARMATNYAGVFTVGDQRNDIIIRGNSPTGLLWQLEDIPIPSPNHYDVLGTTGGTISMLNNNNLSRSDFFTSAFPAEFGNASSGVFDLKLRNGNSEKNEYLAQIGFNGIEAGAEGPISKEDKSSYILNLRYSMLGLVQDLLWVDGLPEYKDINFKLNFPLKSGKISLFGLGGTSSISMNESDDVRSTSINEYKFKNVNGSKTGIAGVNYHHIFSSGTLLKIAIAASYRGPHENADSLLNDQVYLNLDNNQYHQKEFAVTTKLTKKINSRNTISFGCILQNMGFEAQRMSSDDNSGIITIDVPYSVSKKNLVLTQIYWQWKHQINDLIYFQGGMNSIYFQYNNKFGLDPRMGFSMQLTEKSTLGFGYGLHSQLQPLQVYFILSKTGLNAEGRQTYANLETNKNLDFTKSHQFVFSYNYSFNSNLRIKAETYYQYLFQVPVKESKGYFSMINSGAAMSVPEEDSLINKGLGENYGLELTLEKFLSQHYYFLITGSLFNSLYRGADEKWRNTTYNGNFVFNILGGYEYEIKQNVMVNFNLRTIYAGGRRLIPFDLEKSKQKNDTYYLYDQAYEKQVKNYFRMDLRIGVLFQRKKATHELALDIVNLTNQQNIYRQRYDSGLKGVKTSYQQGIFPMGLYRLNF